MRAIACFHDSALGIGEVVLRLWVRDGTRRHRLFGAGLLADSALRGAGGDFGFVFGLFRGRQFAGPFLNHLPCLLQRSHAGFSALQFRRKIQARRFGFLGVGGFGQGDQKLHFQFQLRDHCPGPLVTDGGVLAGIGRDFRPVHADAAYLGQAHLTRQLQHVRERGDERRLVGGAKGADRIVVGMAVVPRDAPSIERIKGRDGTTQALAAEEREDVLLGVTNQGALIQALADAGKDRLHELLTPQVPS